MAGDTAVRSEDAFDVGTVHEWLAGRVDGLDAPPEVRQFSGGASNLTYLLRYPDRELILRRPPAGRKASSAHDMSREYRVQKHLKPVFRYVPEMVAFCDDHDVLGADFYVMERIVGTIPRKDFPPEVQLDPVQARTLAFTVVDTLVELHDVDPAAAGLSDLGRGAGYVERQVRGWSDRYRKARTWNVPKAESVMAWLDEHRPDDVKSCLIHNDYRLDNVVLAPDDPLRVVGVLDWEMATIGDPLMDLGGALAYWIQSDDPYLSQRARRQPTHLPGMPTRREVVEYYCDRAGLSSANWAFYEVFGLFRLAAIAQQIYYRYHHKQTRNPAFRQFWLNVNYLVWRAHKAMR
ncbi:phosphotransferase family protein [Cryptosporangium arvum]|uniref:Putative aminoglycoside phosphotransferase n=1 Tax=Cryptosporangium arvum DSM 44712 TaxID=927661 RepID=A0A010ZSN1_9ACTN|nr:phosphotransferase family protein [Cryptosporangium arvum]EXG80227.1 putative aminoglycoside phosphotransferase [Cryptosporangium arvum DSM 44712]